MRFFTSEWWSGEGDPGAAAAYRRHFESIKQRLPDDLVLVHDRYPLHDGHVRSATASDGAKELRLVVDTWDYDNCYRRLALEYERVTAWHVDCDGEADVAEPQTWGDLGYQEVDANDGTLEHRMIFAAGVELMVRFGGFRLVIEEGPPNPPLERTGLWTIP